MARLGLAAGAAPVALLAAKAAYELTVVVIELGWFVLVALFVSSAPVRRRFAVCNACPLKSGCTGGKSGRAVNRNFDEAHFERVKGYHGLAAYKKAMRTRKVWIEPMFAEAKQGHGVDRLRLRRLERANTEVLVTAAGQNVKRLLAFGPPRPRRAAQAAAPTPGASAWCGSTRHFSTGCGRMVR